MKHLPLPILTAFRAAGFLIPLVWAAAASAQTPSPFNYWQNAAGIVLAPLGGPLPDWRIDLGFGAAGIPLYEGSDHYKTVPAPAFDIRYKDIAFLSSGDGLGVNLIRGPTYRAGIALGYDLGRNAHVSGRLNGLGDVEAAPELRLFGDLALLPFVMTADLRRAIGGHEGIIGDLGLYLPVIGRQDLVVFVGPTVSLANQRYMQAYFGIGTAEAAGSTAHLPAYNASGGFKNVGFGGSAVYNLTDQWFLDADIAIEHLVGSAGNSPIVQDKNQLGVSLIVGYTF